MATIINNPSDTRPVMAEDTSPVGMIVGLIVALVLIVLFVMYVLPSIRGGAYSTGTDTSGGASANLNVTLPDSSTGGTVGGSASGATTQ